MHNEVRVAYIVSLYSNALRYSSEIPINASFCSTAAFWALAAAGLLPNESEK